MTFQSISLHWCRICYNGGMFVRAVFIGNVYTAGTTTIVHLAWIKGKSEDKNCFDLHWTFVTIISQSSEKVKTEWSVAERKLESNRISKGSEYRRYERRRGKEKKRAKKKEDKRSEDINQLDNIWDSDNYCNCNYFLYFGIARVTKSPCKPLMDIRSLREDKWHEERRFWKWGISVWRLWSFQKIIFYSVTRSRRSNSAEQVSESIITKLSTTE